MQPIMAIVILVILVIINVIDAVTAWGVFQKVAPGGDQRGAGKS